MGEHSLTARVEFTPAARTAPRTLRLRFERCAKRALVVKPRFTG